MRVNNFFGLCALASGIALVGCGGDKPTQTDTTAQTTQTATTQTTRHEWP